MKILSAIYTGIEITGFTIEDKDGNIKEISQQDAISLAKNNLLENATAVYNYMDETYKIKVDNGLSSLKREKTKLKNIRILARIVNEDECIGYKISDNNGKEYKINKSKMWDLAFNSNVDGIEAIIVKNGNSVTKVLRSKDSSKQLVDLPVISNTPIQ